MEDKAKALAELWTRRWMESMKIRGKKLTQKGIENYRKAMEGIAKLKLMGEEKSE